MEKYKKPKANKQRDVKQNTLALTITLVIILLSAVATAQKIEENGVIITSDKDLYYCEPIMSQHGCLIRAEINITNKNNQAFLFEFEPEYTTNVKNNKIEITQEITKTKTDPNKTKTEENKLAKIKYDKDDIRIHTLEFWTKTSGKFNITIRAYDTANPNMLVFTTKLDPFYNTTINASIPSYLLINGTNTQSADNQYQTQIDITSGLIDDNTSTQYQTAVSQSFSEISPYKIEGYSFNEITFGNILHGFLGTHQGKILGEIQSVSLGNFYGGRFDDIDDRVEINGAPFQIGTTNYTFCAVINTTASYGNQREFIDLGEASGGDGFSLSQQVDGDAECRWDGTTGLGVLTASTTNINDGTLHAVCCRKIDNNYSMWVDGVQEDSTIFTAGTINNTAYNLSFNIDKDANQRWSGDFDQVAFARTGVSNALLASAGAQKRLTNISLGIAISVVFNHTFQPSTEIYYLYVKSNITTLESYRVYAYINETHINTTRYIDWVSASQQEFIPINSLLNENQTSARLRIFNLLNTGVGSISELLLFESINDTTPPVITNPTLNPQTGIGCLQEAHFSINVSDDEGVNQVILQHTRPDYVLDTHQMSRNGTTNQYTYSEAFFGVFNETRTLNFTRVNATDLAGNVATFLPNLSINYTCISACIENWQQDDPVCTTTDNYTKTYTDVNLCGTIDDLPADNGTIISCNYCSQDIVQITSSCMINQTQNISWTDNNYDFCCLLTSLPSDCGILSSPFNEKTSQSCVYYTKDFNCSIDETPVIAKKINLACELPSDDYTCIVEKYQNVEAQNFLLDVSPQYSNPTNSFIPLWQKETETRTHFTPVNRIINAYYTDKELRPDTLYEIRVKCTNNSTTLVSRNEIRPSYHTYDEWYYRWHWFTNNPWYTFGTFLFIFLTILALIWLAKNTGVIK